MSDSPSPKAAYFSPRFVYLAGPILGCNIGEANDWRKYVAAQLLPHNIVGISPLRCEPLIGERYSTDYPDPCFGTPRAISAKNKFDVQTSDLTFALLPKPIAPRPQSYGTLGEIFWADMFDKRVILVTDDPFVMVHPVIDSAVDWKFCTAEPGSLKGDPGTILLPSLEECVASAIKTCIGVLGGFAGGKNV